MARTLTRKGFSTLNIQIVSLFCAAVPLCNVQNGALICQQWFVHRISSIPAHIPILIALGPPVVARQDEGPSRGFKPLEGPENEV